MKHSLQVTAALLGLFLLTQLVGLKVVDNYIDRAESEKAGKPVYKELPYSIERPDLAPQASMWFIIGAVIIGTGILLVLIYFRQVNLWKMWFFLSVLLTMSISLSSFIMPIIAFISSLVLAILKVFRPNTIIHNLTEIFIYGGLAAIFVPILNIFAVSILLILISLYDMFAVWQSRHMIKMADFQTESKLFSGLYIPPAGKPLKPGKKLADGEIVSRGAVLGGGDMGFPLIFAGVVMKDFGYTAVIIPFACCIALLGLMMLGQKNKFYPAMPFLSAACFLGYAIVAFVL